MYLDLQEDAFGASAILFATFEPDSNFAHNFIRFRMAVFILYFVLGKYENKTKIKNR